MAELSVLIVNYNSWRECAQAIASLRQYGPTHPAGSPMPFEVIVVDNQSPMQHPDLIAGVAEELRLICEQQGDDKAGVLIQHTENGGYSKGMNLAMSHSRGKWILVSNPDLLFGEGLLPSLQRHLEGDPTAGIGVPKGVWDASHAGKAPPPGSQPSAPFPLFEEMPLSSRTKAGLQAGGFTAPTAIQAACIPHALVGRDVLGAEDGGGSLGNVADVAVRRRAALQHSLHVCAAPFPLPVGATIRTSFPARHSAQARRCSTLGSRPAVRTRRAQPSSLVTSIDCAKEFYNANTGRKGAGWRGLAHSVWVDNEVERL